MYTKSSFGLPIFIMISDCHLHTYFSPDSKENPRNYIEKAISLKMPYLCFTDHCDFDYVIEGEGDFLLDKEKYLNELFKLRDEYSRDIDILIGIEQGLEATKVSQINSFLDGEPFDFIIGSSHLVNGKDPYYKDFFLNRSIKEALDEYFDSVLLNISIFDNFDIYGHIDYVARYIPDKSYTYSYNYFKEKIDAILKELIKKGKGIEINTGGCRSKLSTPNPSFDIVKSYVNEGGRIITIGSDAHKLCDFASNFSEIENELKNIGINHYNIFKERKCISMPL